MIHSVAIENFKNLRRIQIDLDRFTVVVGPNASGKTSVLQAVNLAIRAAIKPEPREMFVEDLHCDWLYTRDARGDLRISCGTDRGVVTVGASPPKVEADGEGLASVLAHIALNDPDAFERLVERLRELIPHLKRIRFKKVPIRRQEKELVRFGDDSVERTRFSCCRSTRAAMRSVDDWPIIHSSKSGRTKWPRAKCGACSARSGLLREADAAGLDGRTGKRENRMLRDSDRQGKGTTQESHHEHRECIVRQRNGDSAPRRGRRTVRFHERGGSGHLAAEF
jgi:energy-coupling factor transporter ATP-binding protein EcfA2